MTLHFHINDVIFRYKQQECFNALGGEKGLGSDGAGPTWVKTFLTMIYECQHIGCKLLSYVEKKKRDTTQITASNYFSSVIWYDHQAPLLVSIQTDIILEYYPRLLKAKYMRGM